MRPPKVVMEASIPLLLRSVKSSIVSPVGNEPQSCLVNLDTTNMISARA